MSNSADRQTRPHTFWNKTIVWDRQTPIQKLFPITNSRLQSFLGVSIFGLAIIILVGLICAHFLSLSPLKIYSSSENPLSLSTVITTTTVLAGIYLYLERPEAEKHYSQEHRELVNIGLGLTLLTVFALSSAYSMLPAINSSHCAEDPSLLLNCFAVKAFWIELTSATTLVHLLMLSILFIGGMLLHQLRLPWGLARRDRIMGNARDIQDSLARIAAQRSSKVTNSQDEASLWSATNPRKQKLKLYGRETKICIAHAAFLGVSKTALLCLLYFSNQLPSWQTDFTWYRLLILTSISSLLLVISLYKVHSIKVEYQKLSSNVTVYLFGFLCIYFALLFNLILAAKLVSWWPLIISLIFAGAYAYWWHRSTRKILHKTSKPTRKDPNKICAETLSLSTTEIQKILDHPEEDQEENRKEDNFQKFLTSFSIASRFDNRLHFSKGTCYLLPASVITLPATAKTSEGAPPEMPKSSKDRQLSKYSCGKIISTHLAIKSFETSARLIRLIEDGLKLRSNPEDYNAAAQGEAVAIDRALVPPFETEPHSAPKTLFNFNDH